MSERIPAYDPLRRGEMTAKQRRDAEVRRRLGDLDFKLAGHWKLADGRPSLELWHCQDCSPALYAFLVDGEVAYVGKTTQKLGKRLKLYEKPGPTQSTNIRNNELIRQALVGGSNVEIFVLCDHGELTYGGITLNLPAALEDPLIAEFAPPWNRTGSGTPAKRRPVSRARGAARVSGADDSPEADSFMLKLGKTYWSKGFFNVPRGCGDLLAPHGETVEILCGADSLTLIGRIDRHANANGTPRIHVGVRLARWFQSGFSLNEQAAISVINPNKIKISRP